MILSNDDVSIVEFKYRQDGNKCEGVKMLHCEKGEEKKCLQSEPDLKTAEIVKIVRKGNNKALQMKL